LDVGEVAFLLSGSVQGERVSAESGGDDPTDGHVGSLPRAEDAEIAERHRRQVEVFRVQAAQVLGRQLGDPVGA
jgi:hypothetical protein